MLPYIFDSYLNYVTAMLQLHPSLNHLWQLYGGDAANFWGILIYRYLSPVVLSP